MMGKNYNQVLKLVINTNLYKYIYIYNYYKMIQPKDLKTFKKLQLDNSAVKIFSANHPDKQTYVSYERTREEAIKQVLYIQDMIYDYLYSTKSIRSDDEDHFQYLRGKIHMLRDFFNLTSKEIDWFKRNK